MADFQIDFDWYCAKYDFQPGEPWDSSSHVGEFMRPVVIKGKIWREALSRQEAEKRAPKPPLGYLVRRSTAKIVRPSPKAMELAVKLLVEREKTPLHKVALTIARTVGGLLPATEHDKEELEHWDELADYLRGIFKGYHEQFLFDQGNPNAPPLIGEVGIFLDREKDGKLKLALRPEDLQHALILYAARMATTGTTFQTCQHCNTPFLSGGERHGGGKKKRGGARFCSDRCRWEFHNEVRRKKSRL
jgi:hypothetical protein